MLINVCQSCIDLQRNPNDSKECAIYSALKKEFPSKDIDVNQDTIHIGDHSFTCMPCVYGWQVGNVYNSQRVKPIQLLFDQKSGSVSVYTNELQSQ